MADADPWSGAQLLKESRRWCSLSQSGARPERFPFCCINDCIAAHSSAAGASIATSSRTFLFLYASPTVRIPRPSAPALVGGPAQSLARLAPLSIKLRRNR